MWPLRALSKLAFREDVVFRAFFNDMNSMLADNEVIVEHNRV